MGALPIFSSIPRVSFEEYALQEETNSVRHEFHAGVVTMMAGGNWQHADAASNWLGTLRNLILDKDCRAVGSDMGVWIESQETSLYPDVALYCGSREFRDSSKRYTTNPSLIVEVLSASTRDYDLSAKFSLYKKLPSVGQYICMDPEAIDVHVWTKQSDGEWLRERFTSLGDEIEIQALGRRLQVEQVYAGLL